MATITEECLAAVEREFGELHVLDDVIRHRANDAEQKHTVAYPRGTSITDYEYLQGRDIDRFVDAAAKHLIANGLGPVESGPRKTVALFSISDLDMLVYDVPRSTAPFVRTYDHEKERDEPCVILHSSGSTGFPKPITLTHRAVCSLPLYPLRMRALTTFPLFHMGGLYTILLPLYQGTTVILPNPHVPQTAESLTTLINATKPEWVATVPYMLGLMSEIPESVAALRTAKAVIVGGSKCAEELGDKLQHDGVNVCLFFGSTEGGIIAETMSLPEDDREWSYLRFCKYAEKYLYWDCIDKTKNLYEALYLPGLPSLAIANTDFPVPGSFRSKDVFSPHPTIPNAWRYEMRLDDRVTLANSEKVLPLPIEGTIRTDTLVKEAIVFGIGQPVPGLLVFKAPAADKLSTEAFIDAIWPTVEKANSRAEGFSKIAKDMIIVKDSATVYPRSDKGSFIRHAVYSTFETDISAAYTTTKPKAAAHDLLRLDQKELEAFLISQIKKDAGIDIKPDDDFFAMGVDSLRAVQLRRTILETVDLGPAQQLPSNVVYTCATVRGLAEFLSQLRDPHSAATATGATEAERKVANIRKMIAKYSDFRKHEFSEPVEARDYSKYSVIITGATGSIGAHVLHQLLKKHQRVKTVYCLCRGRNPLLRVLESLRTRKLIKTDADEEYYTSRIVALTAEPQDGADFGLDAATIGKMQREVGVIYHLAWPVNFNMALSSFEPYIRGLKNLLDFSLSVARPAAAQVHFASSISAALNVPPGTVIPSTRTASLDSALAMGYGQSKLVGEELCLAANATAGANAFVLRIGQIMGDTRDGVWNESESYPLMVRAGYHMGTMPEVRETCNWLPVDTLAEAIVDISVQAGSAAQQGAQSDEVDRVYNLAAAEQVPWAEWLAELRGAGLQFRTVPYAAWRAALVESERAGESRLNPAVKLLGHFDASYADGGAGGLGAARFAIDRVQRVSGAMRHLPSLKDGLASRFLANWIPKWRAEEEEEKARQEKQAAAAAAAA
ncbi:putative PKS/NRPS-like protein biosynthetic cluster [Ascosphaera acerosa]|nr:putative PKS/NRPS-like protein biosynthetic cluster [Ascosphaera acerosa]